MAQSTVFGWILSGNASQADRSATNKNVHSFYASTESNVNSFCTSVRQVVNSLSVQPSELSLSKSLEKFWEMEDLGSSRQLSEEDQACEDLFRETTTRDEKGRFVVRLPFSKEFDGTSFRDSRDIAISRLLSSERRRSKDTEFGQAYSQFMKEYLALDHMELVPDNELAKNSFYMPHHAVFRKESKKIRVVFNASQRGKSGLSLNDLLSSGPKLQKDITQVVNSWRFFKYAFTTDIVKMFRQIRVHPDHRDLQRIVWRDASLEKVVDLRATTVTYGTAPAPFLALRCIRQLASDGCEKFPLASKILRGQVYVDDVFAGSNMLIEQ